VPAPWLVAIVGASFLVRTVLGWLRATPAFFPDEYIYAALGRSLAESGRPLIRGGSAHFPALLQPLFTAPAWLIGDVGVAYRVLQTVGALAMSLAAVPVYLIGRRLGLSRGISLAVAALAVLVPDLVYSSYISSEALAYPLVLGAVSAATSALARPTRGSQLAFVALAALAMFARLEFAVLPLVFLLAALAVGARERRVQATVREQLLPLGVFACFLVAALFAGAGRALGYYHEALGLRPHPLELLRWMGLDAMALAYAAGWVIVPGAVIGLWLGLARPRDRRESAFAWMVLLLTLAVLAEAAVLQGGTDALHRSIPPVSGIKERYVFYAVPLLGLCFALYASRRWPLRIVHLAIAAGLVLVSVRLPLSGYASPTTMNASPILYAVAWLGRALGGLGDAATVVAAVVGVMSAIAVLASKRPRLATPVVLGLAVLATGAASAGAVALVVDATRSEKRAVLPGDASWVDHARVGRAVLLQSRGGAPGVSLQELFWNRSIDSVLLLPDAAPIDGFRTQRVSVGADGSLVADGHAVLTPLLVDEYGSTVRLRGARLAAAGPAAALWVPDGRPSLTLYAVGRYYDGWLAGSGSIRLWPASAGGRLRGWLSMRLTAPQDADAGTITLRLPGGRSRSVHLTAGSRRQVKVPVCGTGSWRATYRSSSHRLVGLRLVSVKATAPVFTPEASACAALELAP
jgi:hypothetical protein